MHYGKCQFIEIPEGNIINFSFQEISCADTILASGIYSRDVIVPVNIHSSAVNTVDRNLITAANTRSPQVSNYVPTGWLSRATDTKPARHESPESMLPPHAGSPCYATSGQT